MDQITLDDKITVLVSILEPLATRSYVSENDCMTLRTHCQENLQPLKRIVYGMVGVTLLTVLSAILFLVLKGIS